MGGGNFISRVYYDYGVWMLHQTAVTFIDDVNISSSLATALHRAKPAVVTSMSRCAGGERNIRKHDRLETGDR